jgi:hypothetical protein
MRLGAMRRTLSGPGMGLFLVLAILVLGSAPAQAVPAFAAQTGQPCQACHVGGFGPQLTPLGREFKLGGYTTRADKWTVPFSAMAVASYLRTQKDQAVPPASGFRQNDNTALDQVSLFLAGGFGPHLGAFVQTTYDGIGRSWSWDNIDLRATTTTEIKGVKVVWGASLNNNPTVQDAWNTTPAWGFPYTSSALAPSPTAAPLLAGALAQNTLGLTGYAWINSQLFVEAGGYGSPDKNTLTRLGADPLSPGNIHGLAPYGRIAYQAMTEAGTVEVGVFGLRAEIFPNRDRTTGFTDRYTDLGVDASYQRTFENSDVLTLNARYIDEQQTLNATCALAGENANCAGNHLRDIRADVAYYWRNKIGATVGVFDTFGSANPILNSGNRTFKPDSAGVTLQLDATPFGGESQPARRLNVRVGVQYTFYTQFNGAGSNFDFVGTNAADNNTLRVFTWFAF